MSDFLVHTKDLPVVSKYGAGCDSNFHWCRIITEDGWLPGRAPRIWEVGTTISEMNRVPVPSEQLIPLRATDVRVKSIASFT